MIDLQCYPLRELLREQFLLSDGTCDLEKANRPFAGSGHMVQNNSYGGTQVTLWEFQNKGIFTSPAQLSCVLTVPLRSLLPSIIYFVICDRILQRAYRSANCRVKISIYTACTDILPLLFRVCQGTVKFDTHPSVCH